MSRRIAGSFHLASSHRSISATSGSDTLAGAISASTRRSAAAGERLSRADTARWYMSTAENPMVIGALLLFEGQLRLEELDALVRRKLLAYPRFRQHVVEPRGGWQRPRWQEDVPFDLRSHVGVLPGPISEAALVKLASERMSAPLPAGSSPWRLDLVDLGADGSAVLLRVHHSIADGLALVSVLGELADEPPPQPSHAHPPRVPGRPSLMRRVLSEISGLFRFLTLSRDVTTSLRAPPSGAKRVAWSAALPLDQIKSIAREHGCRLTDILLGAVSVSIERHLRARGNVPAKLRALLPVAGPAGPAPRGLGNHFASVFVGLPLRGGDALARAKAMAPELARLGAEPSLARALVALAGGAWPALERRAVHRWSRRASLVVSTVPGPSQDLHIAGRRLRSVTVWAPAPATVGLSLTLFGYAGGLRLGVLADVAVTDRPADLVDGFEAALAEIGAGVGSLAR